MNVYPPFSIHSGIVLWLNILENLSGYNHTILIRRNPLRHKHSQRIILGHNLVYSNLFNWSLSYRNRLKQIISVRNTFVLKSFTGQLLGKIWNLNAFGVVYWFSGLDWFSWCHCCHVFLWFNHTLRKYTYLFGKLTHNIQLLHTNTAKLYAPKYTPYTHEWQVH